MRRMSRGALLLLASACALPSCTEPDGSISRPNGETPVRFVVCSPGGTNCDLVGRFDDMDSCESHRHWAEMLCDSRSRPGIMICKENPDRSFAVSYCIL